MLARGRAGQVTRRPACRAVQRRIARRREKPVTRVDETDGGGMAHEIAKHGVSARGGESWCGISGFTARRGTLGCCCQISPSSGRRGAGQYLTFWPAQPRQCCRNRTHRIQVCESDARSFLPAAERPQPAAAHRGAVVSSVQCSARCIWKRAGDDAVRPVWPLPSRERPSGHARAVLAAGL